jgi:hypothetical protein
MNFGGFFLLWYQYLFPNVCRDYHIGSNFSKFYLLRTIFTSGEPVSLVKVFRLFRLKPF